jgi:D-3-phosphoglycerate dehydrogenase
LKPKVLVAQPIAREGIDLLLRNGFEVKELDRFSPEALQEEIGNYDALLVRDARVPREVIEKGRKLRVISRHGAGLESIDVQAATENGIQVTNTPVANSNSVAEHVLAVMLALARNLLHSDRELRRGNFDIRHAFYGMELEGKTLSILGLGQVGRRLAKKAVHGLGMKVVGYDPYANRGELIPEIEITSDWEKFFAEGDFVSLHLPLDEKTRGIVGRKEFQ